MTIALSALDSGRLGIAAVAPGSPRRRSTSRSRTPGAPAVRAADQRLPGAVVPARRHGGRRRRRARATYLHAARLKDAGRPFSQQAAVAKLVATDAAMKVTTDAVQVLGGYGYTQDFPVERYMREAKVTQIFEGTNQIQRLVIARQLLRG